MLGWLNEEGDTAEHVAGVWEMGNIYNALIGNSYGQGTLWKLRQRWEDDIKMYLKEEGVKWDFRFSQRWVRSWLSSGMLRFVVW
jgi:hypothetical protein